MSETVDTVEDNIEVVQDVEQAQADTTPEHDDDVVVTIGEDAPPQEEATPAPDWVRELRKSHRELQKQNRELQAKLQTSTTETKPVALGKKPTLEDHDYDAEKFEAAFDDWMERKRQVQEAQTKQEAEVMNQQKAWQEKLEGYSKAKAEIKVKDYDDAEALAQEVLNVTQQGIVLQGADNPALVIYALGKNPTKAKEIGSIKDPVKFAFAVAKLEKELKVTNRKVATAPEKVITSNGGALSGGLDSTLERLRVEAEKTGNYTKVYQYKRQKQAAKS
jgi:hypothetical protein